MKITVVLPLYNEKKHILKVIKDIQKFNLETVVVDDGSTDPGGELVLKTKATLLTHLINLGKGAAMKTGAEYAFANDADCVIFMDSDGQHNAADLRHFINKIKTERFDVIIGSRNLREKAPFMRYVGNKIASLIINIFFGINITDPLCGFRAITKKAYKKIKWDSTGYSVEMEILAKVAREKLRFTEIPVDTIYHDKDKGVTLLDAFDVMFNVLKWKLTK